MKTTKAQSPKTSKVKKSEKGSSLFGNRPAPKLPTKKQTTPAIGGKQHGQAHLAPKHKKI